MTEEAFFAPSVDHSYRAGVPSGFRLSVPVTREEPFAACISDVPWATQSLPLGPISNSSLPTCCPLTMMRNFPLSATNAVSGLAEPADTGCGRRFAWDGAGAIRTPGTTNSLGSRNTGCWERKVRFRIMQSPWGKFPMREFVPLRAEARYWFLLGSRRVRKTASVLRKVSES